MIWQNVQEEEHEYYRESFGTHLVPSLAQSGSLLQAPSVGMSKHFFHIEVAIAVFITYPAVTHRAEIQMSIVI